MRERKFVATTLMMLFMGLMIVPVQAQFGWPNPRQRDDDYRYGSGNGSVTWSGSVDGEVIIRFRRDNAWTQNVSGQGVWSERYRFNSLLTSGVSSVYLSNARGRGEVVVLEHPSRRNNFTAAVLVRDRQSGPSFYSFVLSWDNSRNNNDPWGGRDRRDRDYDDRDWRDRDRNDDWGNGRGQRGMTWSGRVDGRGILFIRGNRAWFERQTGSPIYDDRASFYNSLPRTSCELDIRKLRGRGQVQLLEAPSAYNDYTAKILLDDRDGGDDRYELEVLWR